jgi:hypothetical protein
LPNVQITNANQPKLASERAVFLESYLYAVPQRFAGASLAVTASFAAVLSYRWF